LLITIGVSLGVRSQIAGAKDQIAANERPLPAAFAASRPRFVEAPAPSPRRETPGTIEAPAIDNPPLYDLDYLRPMPTDVRDIRDTKATY